MGQLSQLTMDVVSVRPLPLAETAGAPSRRTQGLRFRRKEHLSGLIPPRTHSSRPPGHVPTRVSLQGGRYPRLSSSHWLCSAALGPHSGLSQGRPSPRCPCTPELTKPVHRQYLQPISASGCQPEGSPGAFHVILKNTVTQVCVSS